jgi:hypothetical protein
MLKDDDDDEDDTGIFLLSVFMEIKFCRMEINALLRRKINNISETIYLEAKNSNNNNNN